MRVKVDVSEFVPTKDGGYIKHSTRYDEYPDDNRHSLLCTACGWSDYPECREWCQHEGYEAEKKRSEQSKSQV